MDNNFVIHYEFIRLTTKQLFANNHFLTKWPKPDFCSFFNITRLYYAGQEKWLRILKLHAILRVSSYLEVEKVLHPMDQLFTWKSGVKMQQN